MKIRHKTVLAIAAVCSCLSMFCIGFSNWSIGTENSFEISSQGNVTSEDVIVSNEYIRVTQVDPFTYTPWGFATLDADGNVESTSYEGYMYVTCEVNMANCSSLATGNDMLAADNDISVCVEMSHQTQILQYITEVTLEDNNNSQIQLGTSESSMLQYNTWLTLKQPMDKTGVKTFTLKYKFASSSGVGTQAWYYRSICKVLGNDSGKLSGFTFRIVLSV